MNIQSIITQSLISGQDKEVLSKKFSVGDRVLAQVDYDVSEGVLIMREAVVHENRPEQGGCQVRLEDGRLAGCMYYELMHTVVA